jgi:hypothetical protein
MGSTQPATAGKLTELLSDRFSQAIDCRPLPDSWAPLHCANRTNPACPAPWPSRVSDGVPLRHHRDTDHFAGTNCTSRPPMTAPSAGRSCHIRPPGTPAASRAPFPTTRNWPPARLARLAIEFTFVAHASCDPADPAALKGSLR